MRLETERLILRELTINDLDDLHEILSDPESMLHYPQPFTKEKSRQWIEWNIDNYITYGFGLWAVILKENNRFLGDCGITLQCINGKQEPEIGYHINKVYTGRGYATEAARACRNYVFDVLNLQEVFSYMKYTNIASQRVAQKNGMKLVAELPDDKNTLTTVFAITLEDYLNTKF
ncbi:RimJ/RimL family protein N-acetyltransferase [Enterococcus sp. PF1-24]|uniref:GNAT family N-acetyltransferase n=1 Tax=unclassified Enterococcus TaxID=2608891 RepID=UPI002474EC51|nr:MULTISPECIES: GNAT family N-acetyltransferase [unclassified Enterococcus]MDH6364683.1 RimJ/RimL family protein N-acetyltransferase [Enterococcus sp. PFB1-1]MDH6401841.1 RimJ/RimL family protein N-acetyltransferase [Enterococcus sp. PF1-24]